MTILDLVQGLRKTSPTEYHGPCPWCAGTDRFVVWPRGGREKRGRYWCRQCDRRGDAIDLLREVAGLDYRGAVEKLRMQHTRSDFAPTIEHALDRASARRATPPPAPPQQVEAAPDAPDVLAYADAVSCYRRGIVVSWPVAVNPCIDAGRLVSRMEGIFGATRYEAWTLLRLWAWRLGVLERLAEAFSTAMGEIIPGTTRRAPVGSWHGKAARDIEEVFGLMPDGWDATARLPVLGDGDIRAEGVRRLPTWALARLMHYAYESGDAALYNAAASYAYDRYGPLLRCLWLFATRYPMPFADDAFRLTGRVAEELLPLLGVPPSNAAFYHDAITLQPRTAVMPPPYRISGSPRARKQPQSSTRASYVRHTRTP